MLEYKMNQTTTTELNPSFSYEVYSGLITTVFTLSSYALWKLVKRYVLKSSCVNGELHITVKELNDKVTATNDIVNEFFSEMIRAYNRESQNVPLRFTQSNATSDEKDEKKADH